MDKKQCLQLKRAFAIHGKPAGTPGASSHSSEIQMYTVGSFLDTFAVHCTEMPPALCWNPMAKKEDKKQKKKQ